MGLLPQLRGAVGTGRGERSVYAHPRRSTTGEGPYASQTGDGRERTTRHGVLTESDHPRLAPHLRLPRRGRAGPCPCSRPRPLRRPGTTALAANRLGRDCTLVELKAATVTRLQTLAAQKRLATEGAAPDLLPPW